MLTDLRRQFHTLKGSGRTANVGPLAEIAWVAERTLSEVIDRSLETTDELRSIVEDATQTIKESLVYAWYNLPLYPTTEGYGRTDGLGRIANTVYGDRMSPLRQRLLERCLPRPTWNWVK